MKKMPWSRIVIIFILILIAIILLSVLYKPAAKVSLAPASGNSCSAGKSACTGTGAYANEVCCYGAEGECTRSVSGKPVCVKACQVLQLTCPKSNVQSNNQCCYGACDSCRSHL